MSQQFAIIALDGLSCSHRSAAKCAAVRGIAAALLDEILSGNKEMRAEAFQKRLEMGIAAIKRRNRKEMDAVEADMRRLLSADGGMEIDQFKGISSDFGFSVTFKVL